MSFMRRSTKPKIVPVQNSEWFDRDRPYKRKGRLLTRSEAIMLEKLRLVFPRAEFEVFPNVRLADLIEVDIPRWQSKRRDLEINDIARFHLDFVICKKTTTEILAAIELDDPSHDDAKAQHRDERKNRALKAAGVVLHRFRAENDDSYKRLRAVILGESLDETVETAHEEESPTFIEDDASRSRAYKEIIVIPPEKNKAADNSNAVKTSGWGRHDLLGDQPLRRNDASRSGWGKTGSVVGRLAISITAVLLGLTLANFIVVDRVKTFINDRLIKPGPVISQQNSIPDNAGKLKENTAVVPAPGVAKVREIPRPEMAMNAKEERFDSISQQNLSQFDFEAAWSRWYKRPDYCNSDIEKALIACANDYIRKRREFEKLVASGKIH